MSPLSASTLSVWCPSLKGVVPLKLGYGYLCGNIVGEDDTLVSSY
jgi:hypothetical protein